MSKECRFVTLGTTWTLTFIIGAGASPSCSLWLAEITSIPLTGKDGKPAIDRYGNREATKPHAKMLRHTFAVGELVRGVSEEAVAKELGHADTTMIRKHYAPWCKAREDAHLRTIISARASKAKGA